MIYMNTPISSRSDEAVATNWRGDSLLQGEDVMSLSTGDLVRPDTDEMSDYIAFRIRKLGGVDKWITDDLGEEVSGFVATLTATEIGLFKAGDEAEYFDFLVDKFGSLGAWITERLGEKSVDFVISRLGYDTIQIEQLFENYYEAEYGKAGEDF